MLYSLLSQTQLKMMSKSGFRTLTNFNLKSAAAQPKMLGFEKFQNGPSFLGVYFPKMPYVKNRGSYKIKLPHSQGRTGTIYCFPNVSFWSEID